MSSQSHEFDVAQICRETAVRRVELHDALPSTNDLALQLAATVPPEDLPLLVLAVRQTGGRGRGNHRWWAADGALTFSLLLDTQALRIEPRQWPRVSLATGIAVARALVSQLPDQNVRVKWPNDVYIRGRKVCGILTENAPRQPQRLVIGIGVNVNNTWREAPAELQAVGTSLADVAQRTLLPHEILLDLLGHLLQSLADVAGDSFPLSDTWRELCLLEGHTVTVQAGGNRMTGVCQGIDDEGALLLHTDTGIQRCVAGSVIEIK